MYQSNANNKKADFVILLSKVKSNKQKIKYDKDTFYNENHNC